MTTKWGIAGCGKISSDFANAILHDSAEQHEIVAVAARSMLAAEQFAGRFGAKRFYDSYDKLANDENVDVVYVGTINTTHYDIVKSLLEARKAVLCEKPMTTNLAQTQQLAALARQRGTFLMEAMWSRFMPVYHEMKKRITAGDIGDVTHAYVSFGQSMANVQRLIRKDMGGGSVLDIGIYAINFLLCAIGEETPLEVQAMGQLNDQGIEGEVSASFRFSNNRFGTFNLSITSVLPNEAFVTGTKGTIKLEEPFWSSESLKSSSGDFNSPLDASDRDFIFPNSQGLKYEAAEVAKCLKEDRIESTTMPLSSSLLLAEIMQTVRHKVGAQQF